MAADLFLDTGLELVDMASLLALALDEPGLATPLLLVEALAFARDEDL